MGASSKSSCMERWSELDSFVAIFEWVPPCSLEEDMLWRLSRELEVMLEIVYLLFLLLVPPRRLHRHQPPILDHVIIILLTVLIPIIIFIRLPTLHVLLQYLQIFEELFLLKLIERRYLFELVDLFFEGCVAAGDVDVEEKDESESRTQCIPRILT